MTHSPLTSRAASTARGHARVRVLLRVLLRVAALTATLAVGAATSSCLGNEDVAAADYAAGMFPKVAYSGYNAGASFRVLFATSATDVKWAVGDPAVATVEPAAAPKNASAGTKDLSYALVTTKRAGETTVTVTSRGTTLTSRLVVKAYTNEDMTTGRARYEVGGAEPARAACASCHAKPDGVDHSPLKMAGFEDATILGVIQEASYPPSRTGQAVASDYAPTGPLAFKEHKWALTEPEKVGILAHLRSLPLGR